MHKMENLVPLMKEAFGQGLCFTFPIHGTSMRPLLRTGDLVTLKPVEELHKGDIVLYQRTNGAYVLHRIRHIKKDTYTMVGDHQRVTEKGLRPEQILAVAIGYRKQEEEKERDFKGIRYKTYRILVRISLLRWLFGRIYK